MLYISRHSTITNRIRVRPKARGRKMTLFVHMYQGQGWLSAIGEPVPLVSEGDRYKLREVASRRCARELANMEFLIPKPSVPQVQNNQSSSSSGWQPYSSEDMQTDDVGYRLNYTRSRVNKKAILTHVGYSGKTNRPSSFTQVAGAMRNGQRRAMLMIGGLF